MQAFPSASSPISAEVARQAVQWWLQLNSGKAQARQHDGLQRFLAHRAALLAAVLELGQRVHQFHHCGNGGVEAVAAAIVVADFADGLVGLAAQRLLVGIQCGHVQRRSGTVGGMLLHLGPQAAQEAGHAVHRQIRNVVFVGNAKRRAKHLGAGFVERRLLRAGDYPVVHFLLHHGLHDFLHQIDLCPHVGGGHQQVALFYFLCTQNTFAVSTTNFILSECKSSASGGCRCTTRA